jgi:hypothetical protein
MKRLILIAAMAMAGCATQSAGTTALLTAEATDSGALAALVVYEKTPSPNETTIKKLLADQALVDTALAPSEAAAEAGQSVTLSTAATGAIAALVADETANGINPTGVQ